MPTIDPGHTACDEDFSWHKTGIVGTGDGTRSDRRRVAPCALTDSDLLLSAQFATLATEFGVRLSVGRTGQCWDNALAESFFATIKRELLDTSHWPSRAAARTAISRLHRGLVQLAPTVQQPRLPQSRRIRDRTRSLTTTPMVSVNAEQAQWNWVSGRSWGQSQSTPVQPSDSTSPPTCRLGPRLAPPDDGRTPEESRMPSAYCLLTCFTSHQ
ncbi:integrase core domain-containing protein [Streptomyces sp. SD15]